MKISLVTLTAAAMMLAPATGVSAKSHEPPAPKLTDKQSKALDMALKGKVPGKPVACVSMIPGGSNLQTISDSVLIYRINKNLVYRNDLTGSCHGISSGNTLVLKPTGGQYCRGDIAYAADLSIGMQTGTCVLGDFVPYRTPGK